MKTKLSLNQALPLAEKIKDALAPACERVEIAGSIRRRKQTIGDIEIVAIPKFIPDMMAQLSIFGDPPKIVSALDLLLNKWCDLKDNFRRGDKNGPHYKNFLVTIDDEDDTAVGLDLFLCTPENWGYIFALRTGPAEFNKAWVTQRSQGGLLPEQHLFSGGYLYRSGSKVETPKESDVFNLIGGIIPPQNRDLWRQYYKGFTEDKTFFWECPECEAVNDIKSDYCHVCQTDLRPFYRERLK